MGGAALLVIGLVPILGTLAAIAATVFGLGAVLSALGSRPAPAS